MKHHLLKVACASAFPFMSPGFGRQDHPVPAPFFRALPQKERATSFWLPLKTTPFEDRVPCELEGINQNGWSLNSLKGRAGTLADCVLRKAGASVRRRAGGRPPAKEPKANDRFVYRTSRLLAVNLGLPWVLAPPLSNKCVV